MQLRIFALFSSIFLLGKQAKYSFCRPHICGLWSINASAFRFLNGNSKQGLSFAGRNKKLEQSELQKPKPSLTHRNYHKEHNFPPFKGIRVRKFQRASQPARSGSQTSSRPATRTLHGLPSQKQKLRSGVCRRH